jgi:4-amino-4-deoxy-L-arabinose transferase-like glycosyltransferase
LLASGFLLYLSLNLHQTLRPTLVAPAVTAWVGANAAFLLCCHWLDREAGDAIPLRMTWTRRDWLLVLSLLALAALFRFPALGQFPVAMHNDEGALSYEAVKVLDGRIQSPFVVGWYGHPTLWAYLNAVVLAATGPTLAGARTVAAVIGMLTVGTTYYMARLLYARPVAILAGVLLATYHFHIHFSRIALNNIADPFFGTLIVSAFSLGIYTKRRLFFGLTGLLAGLALFFYMGARLFLPLLVLIGASWLLLHPAALQRWRSPRNWYPVFLVVAGLIFAAGPLLYMFLGQPELFLIRFQIEGLTAATMTQLMEANGWSRGQLLANHLGRASLLFYSTVDRNFDFYDTERSLLWGLANGLLVLGILTALARLRRWPYHIPLAWFGLTVLFAGMLMDYPIKTPRFITLAPVVCIFMAFGLQFLYVTAMAAFPGRRFIAPLLAGGLLLILVATNLHGYFVDYRARESYGRWTSETATLLAQTLAQEAEPVELWFLGNRSVTYAGFPILWFLAPNVSGHDVRQTLTSSTHVQLGSPERRQIYAAIEPRIEELQRVEERAPGGERTRMIWPPTGQTLFEIYRIPIGGMDH